MHAFHSKRQTISSTMEWTLSIICMLVVANLYYDQMLLPDLAHTFHLPFQHIGVVLTVLQLGYTAGLLLIVPLGDRWERKRLIMLSLGCSALCLFMMTIVHSFGWLLFFATLLGFSGFAAQMIIPYLASTLVAPRKSAAISKCLTGIFLGTLLGRLSGGWIGQLWGWTAVHDVAAIALLIGMIIVYIYLPTDYALKEPSYVRIMSSLWTLIRTEPILRETMWIGAITFTVFNIFWAPLSHLLHQAPYDLNSGMASNFGLIGMAGALAAGFASKLPNRVHIRYWNMFALGLMLISFIVLSIPWNQLWILIAVTFVLDIGSRMNMSLNQARLYQLAPAYHSRLNSIYMVSYYIGGAIGSYIGTTVAASYHFPTLALIAILLLCIGLLSIYVHIVRDANAESVTK
ncbi:MFS transporter [Paenibacillus wenxiniae]|uniref:MFS transporter n=1 Tax=Paenibacillus wenxiniae TaxID=1636843 RepID=A0ABW4RQM9_9BACL